MFQPSFWWCRISQQSTVWSRTCIMGALNKKYTHQVAKTIKKPMVSWLASSRFSRNWPNDTRRDVIFCWRMISAMGTSGTRQIKRQRAILQWLGLWGAASCNNISWDIVGYPVEPTILWGYVFWDVSLIFLDFLSTWMQDWSRIDVATSRWMMVRIGVTIPKGLIF